MASVMRGVACFVALSVAACSSAGKPVDAGPDAGDAGLGPDAGPFDGGDGGDAGSADAGVAEDAGDGGDAGTTDDGGMSDGGLDGGDGGPYCPASYSLTPFLTATATTHTFAHAEQVLDSQADYLAVLDTDQGRIAMHLLSGVAPITCNSFVFLTLNHFFDGIAFHRVIDGFVAQGGDPNTLTSDTSTWGTGGPGYFFGLEVSPTVNFDGGAGVVGMARAANPNTNGSQFFITFADANNLNQQYTIFAEVTEGLDVLPNIARGQPPAIPTRMSAVHICQK